MDDSLFSSKLEKNNLWLIQYGWVVMILIGTLILLLLDNILLERITNIQIEKVNEQYMLDSDNHIRLLDSICLTDSLNQKYYFSVGKEIVKNNEQKIILHPYDIYSTKESELIKLRLIEENSILNLAYEYYLR